MDKSYIIINVLLACKYGDLLWKFSVCCGSGRANNSHGISLGSPFDARTQIFERAKRKAISEALSGCLKELWYLLGILPCLVTHLTSFSFAFEDLQRTAFQEISSGSRNREWTPGIFFVQPSSHRNSSSLSSRSLLGRPLVARRLTCSGAINSNLVRSQFPHIAYQLGNQLLSQHQLFMGTIKHQIGHNTRKTSKYTLCGFCTRDFAIDRTLGDSVQRHYRLKFSARRQLGRAPFFRSTVSFETKVTNIIACHASASIAISAWHRWPSADGLDLFSGPA